MATLHQNLIPDFATLSIFFMFFLSCLLNKIELNVTNGRLHHRQIWENYITNRLGVSY